MRFVLLSVLCILTACGTEAVPPSFASSKAFFHTNGFVGVVAQNGQVKQWDQNGTLSKEISTELGTLYFTQILPDGQHVLMAEEKTVRLVDSTGQDPQMVLARSGSDIVGAKYITQNRVVLMTRSGWLEEWSDQQKVLEFPLEWDRDNPKVIEGIFSPKGNLVLTLTSGDRVARVWDYRTGSLVVVLGGSFSHTDQIQAALFSSDGKQVVTGGVDGKILLWTLQGRDPYTGFPIQVGAYNGSVTSLAMTSDRRMVVSGDDKGTVRLWKAQQYSYRGGIYQNFAPFRSFYPTKGKVESVACSLDGQFFVSVGDDKVVHVYENEPEVLTSWPLSADKVVFSEDGSKFLILQNGSISKVQVFKTDDLKNNQGLPAKPEASLQSQTSPYYTAKFSPDGTKVLGAGIQLLGRGSDISGRVEVWDIQSLPNPTLLGVADDAISIYQGPVILPGNRFLATTLLSEANRQCAQLTLWDMNQKTASPVPMEPPRFTPWYQLPCVIDQAAQFVVFSKDGTYMLPLSNKASEILLWDISRLAQKQIRSLGVLPNQDAPQGFNFAQFSSDRTHIYTLTAKGLFQDWDLSNPEKPTLLSSWSFSDAPLYQNSISAIGFSDSKWMVSLKEDHVKIFDTQNQRFLYSFLPSELELVKSAALSLDGSYVLVSTESRNPTSQTEDSQVFLWKIPNPKERFHLNL